PGRAPPPGPQVEPRADDRGPSSPTAFGRAFADALHRLACGGRLKTNGELRVLYIAPVLLERLLVVRLDRDREVTHAADREAVGVESSLCPPDDLLLDVCVVRRDAQDRPALRA